VLFMVVFAGMILFLRRQVTNPLRRISGTIEQITAGATDIKIESTGRKDEIGTVFQALSTFQQQAQRASMLEMASADTRNTETARQQNVTLAIADFQVLIRETRSGLSQGIMSLTSASQDVSAMAVDTERGTRAVAQSSQSSTAAAHQIAQATAEMRASIYEIANQISVASTAISNTSELGTVSRANVTQLADAAEKIDSVIELIRNIAGQTNLLALNATIEAARAGDAGRGFAVVATEVKALAGQTEQATNEIAAQIAGIKTSINATVSGIRDMVGAFGQAEGAIGSIAGAIEEQTSTAAEIAEAAGTAANSAAQTTEFLADVVQVVERARKSTQMIEQVAQSLEIRSQELGQSVDHFLGSVEAA
jgi:methyl-accepting chemotaxis protein